MLSLKTLTMKRRHPQRIMNRRDDEHAGTALAAPDGVYYTSIVRFLPSLPCRSTKCVPASGRSDLMSARAISIDSHFASPIVQILSSAWLSPPKWEGGCAIFIATMHQVPRRAVQQPGWQG